MGGAGRSQAKCRGPANSSLACKIPRPSPSSQNRCRWRANFLASEVPRVGVWNDAVGLQVGGQVEGSPRDWGDHDPEGGTALGWGPQLRSAQGPSHPCDHLFLWKEPLLCVVSGRRPWAVRARVTSLCSGVEEGQRIWGQRRAWRLRGVQWSVSEKRGLGSASVLGATAYASTVLKNSKFISSRVKIFQLKS